ncbi:sulfite exporter TauE/SafE family protein [Variovorax sp. RA8]|uniref:sulfite exporter TauE/SafE family protein n=1 Tax=Variovorax sp. (strain JCM 16519 / RA8) TaxID=662548 RepID=UPI00131755F1|nr:sulfite exporter TauE/SafE family protein [Variovorax sp. RA8]VTU27434.1 Sulfite exporter TauE/SafE [Variovorax sp. RA8]
MDRVLAWSLLIALAGGLVRGTTGFGAAMVMTPALTLLMDARTAVPVTLLLETFAAAPMLPAAWRESRARVIAPISIAAVLAVPAGGLLLAMASPLTLRRIIAATVVLFSLALLSGRRYKGAPRLGTSIGLGALSGTMLGATSIGAPPVILYLLSGPDPASVTRANLTLYVVVISAAGLAMLGVGGLLTAATVRQAALLAVPFAIGILLGSRLFARFSDQRFRQLTMLLMFAVALGVLLSS